MSFAAIMTPTSSVPVTESTKPSLKEITLARATEYGTRSHAAGYGCANDDPEFSAFLATTTATVRDSMRRAATIDILDAYNTAWQAAARAAQPDTEETP